MAQALASQCPSSGQLQLLLSSACLCIPGAMEDAVCHARQAPLPIVSAEGRCKQQAVCAWRHCMRLATQQWAFFFPCRLGK